MLEVIVFLAMASFQHDQGVVSSTRFWLAVMTIVLAYFGAWFMCVLIERQMRMRFADHPEPVLHALTGALLTGNRTATVLLGQRNAKQVAAASKVGEPLSEADAAWVRRVYRGE